MSTSSPSSSLPPSSQPDRDDPVARARALAPLVREAADEADRERRLPAHIAKAMAEAGLYRVSAPRALQGEEASPATQIRTIEAVSEADGATGWNLMIGIESFGLLSMGLPVAPELFADPLAIPASSTAAVGRAVAVDGGYRVSGDWQFVSGVHNCRWFAGLSAIHDGDTPRAGALPGFAIVAADDIEILDTWHTAGMRGSGSHDVQVRDVFVPSERFAAVGTMGVDSAGPLACIPTGSRLAYNKVGVALGVARAAIDDFVEIASGKIPRFASTSLRERPLAQRAAALAEARLRGARAFVLESVDALWEDALAGRRPSERDRALLQIACSDAVRAAAEAVDLVAEAAGTTANRLDSPLERRVRDVRVVRQHVTVAPHHIDDAGRVLLGLEPEGLMLKMAG